LIIESIWILVLLKKKDYTKVLFGSEPLPMSGCETIEDYYVSKEVIAKFISEEEAVEGIKNLIMETAIND